MRFIAFILALGCTAPAASAADWLSLSAETKRSAKSLTPIVYSPHETVAEFNERLAARDLEQTLLVQVSLLGHQISARNLVDQPVTFTCEGQKFSGRVASAFIRTSDGSIQIQAHINNQKEGGKWLLPSNAKGQLSVSNPS